MADIEKLIQDLQSDNPGKRFHACNELFYAQSIPESAIEALRKATQDSDPVIANAAQRALDIHTIQTTSIPPIEMHDEYDRIIKSRQDKYVMIGLAGVIAFITSILLGYNYEFLETGNDTSYFIVSVMYLLIITLPSIIVAMTILALFFRSGRRDKWNNKILDVILTIIVGLLIGIAGFSPCFFVKFYLW